MVLSVFVGGVLVLAAFLLANRLAEAISPMGFGYWAVWIGSMLAMAALAAAGLNLARRR